jgi:hypothetical protein
MVIRLVSPPDRADDSDDKERARGKRVKATTRRGNSLLYIVYTGEHLSFVSAVLR